MPKKLVAFLSATLVAAAGLLIALTPGSHVIGHGCFHRVAHRGSGCATLIRVIDGKTVLKLTDFATSDNPDLRVLLISAEDALENSAVLNSQILDLGPLQSATGSQEYVVPRSADVADFKAVAIWNTRYQVNFTTAPLKGE